MLVIGASGSGKSTAARLLSDRLGVPHVELDGLFHLEQWRENPRFAEDVDASTAGAAWVCDGNYTVVRDLLWDRAQTLVWLDLPRTLTFRRVAVRTLRRIVRREVLWNGNRERLGAPAGGAAADPAGRQPLAERRPSSHFGSCEALPT